MVSSVCHRSNLTFEKHPQTKYRTYRDVNQVRVSTIQSVNRYQFHAWKVAECLFYTMIFVVYNQRTSTHYISSVSHFSFTTSDLFGLLAFLYIVICTQCLQ